MTSTGNILIDGDGSSPRAWASQNYSTIDEAVGTSGEDSDYVAATDDTNNNDTSFTLGAVPGDFGTMNSLQYNIRYRQQGRDASRPDIYGLDIRVVSGATILAAADLAGTFQTVAADITSTSFASSGLVSFTYVNAGAGASIWNAAVVEFRQTYTKNSGGDIGHVEVSSFHLLGDYNIGSSRRIFLIT